MKIFTLRPGGRIWNSFTSAAIAATLIGLSSTFVSAQTGHVVISQVYGGGGNSGAAFSHDFVELFNTTGDTVSLDGWSIQYGAPAGSSWNANALTGDIPPGRYFLIRMAAGAAGEGAPLPTPDQIGSLNLGTVGGKLALVNTTTTLTGTGCPVPPGVIDLVGWGTANCAEGTTSAAHANQTSTRRVNSCIDTDSNSADLATANPPTPRNTSNSPLYCYPVQLVITSIVPATPEAGSGSDVTVQAQNAIGNAQNVLEATTIELSTNGNAGPIGGNTTGIIAQGASSVTISGVILSTAGTDVTITATRTAGQLYLEPGTSAPFTVTGGTNTLVFFQTSAMTVDEEAGTVDLNVSIANPSATEATSVFVALTSGNADLVGGYSGQTVTFPAGSSAPQTITLSVVDDEECAGTEVLSFGLENVSGGQGDAGTTIPSTHTLTVVDNDQLTGVQLARQYFSGAGNDNWTISAGAANVSTAVGDNDTPADQRILSAPASWQVSNATATLDLATIFPNQWSDMVVRARVSSLSETTTTNGADQGDQIRFYIDLDGAGFPTDPDMTITGNNNARWGYASGTGVASTTAGVPMTFTPTGGGNLTDQGYSYVEIDIPNGTQSIALRVVAVNNADNEVWALDNIEITGSACPSTYYSEASGTMQDPIWSPFPGGTPGPALINEATNVVVQAGDVVTNSTNTNIHDLTIETGGTLELTSNFGISVFGNEFTVDGTLVTNEGAIVLAGPGTVEFGGSAPVDLYDLTVNTPGGTTANGIIDIRGTLLLAQGIFDATNATVTLISNEEGTARLGEVGAGAGLAGDVTVQRYIPGGATNWRLLGSPVAGATVEQWMDDFYTAGFPGSHFSEFFDPPGVYWPSIRWYDETVPGADVNDGVVGVESSQTILEQGRGYAAWSGDSLNGTSPFTIDVTGPPHIAQDPIALPLSYTDSGNPAADGFNLVSNPVASAIDFEAIEKGADVQNTYYVYDPATGNNHAWSNGFGTGTADGIIRSGQGFWMVATGPDATAAVHESDKVDVTSGGAFGGSLIQGVPMLRVEVSSDLVPYKDEGLIVFEGGTPQYDAGEDVLKFVYAHPDAPQVTIRSADGQDLHIDRHGAYEQEISIPLTVDVAITGTYTLSAHRLGMSGLSCLTLEDLLTGTLTPLNAGNSYDFEIDADDDAASPRFLIHGTAPMPFTTSDVLCSGEATGAAVVDLGGAIADVTWADAFGQPAALVDDASGTIEWNDLEAGGYMVIVSGTGTGCGDLVQEFTIDTPFILEGEVPSVQAASCPAMEDGVVELLPLGGVGPYEFLWSNGATTQHLENAAPGSHTVTITDANGCSWTSEEIPVGVMDDAPEASFEVEGTVIVGVPALLVNTSQNGEAYLWDMGDGTTSEEFEPTHVFQEPGLHTVSLTVVYGDCEVTHSVDIMVETSTGISGSGQEGLHVWSADGHLMVRHPFGSGNVLIEVMDATGRVHIRHDPRAVPGIVTVPAQELSTGVWFVRVTDGRTQHVSRVPLVK